LQYIQKISQFSSLVECGCLFRSLRAQGYALLALRECDSSYDSGEFCLIIVSKKSKTSAIANSYLRKLIFARLLV
jgi:hypothetical protein